MATNAGSTAAVSEPPRVIFIHVPKTGGLTLRAVMRRQYPGDTLFTSPPDTKDTNDEYLAYLRHGGEQPLRRSGDCNRWERDALEAMPEDRRERIRGLLGHYWYGLHQAVPPPSTYVTILRNPVDRVLSLYHHRRVRHGITLSLGEYVASGRDFEAMNSETRRLSGSEARLRVDPCTQDELEAAKRHLTEDFAVVGLTERFDESLLLIQAVLGWRRVHYVRQNRAPGRPVRQAVAPDVIEAIADHNRFDLELYRFAQELFERQLARTLPDADVHLRRFRVVNSVIDRPGRALQAYRAPVRRRLLRARSRVRGLARRVLG